MTDEQFRELIWKMNQSDVYSALEGLATGRVRRRFRKPVSRYIPYFREDESTEELAFREVISLAVKRQRVTLTSKDFNSHREGWCKSRLRRLEIPVIENVALGGQSIPETTALEEEEQYEADDQYRQAKCRVRHSQFSSLVTRNFEGRCCLTGVAERELLVAGHIVPWCEDKKIRLDPSNGLLLESRYDRLFEEGYFTFTDELVVQIATTKGLSRTLRKILKQVDGRQARKPVIWQIGSDHLRRHREETFRG